MGGFTLRADETSLRDRILDRTEKSGYDTKKMSRLTVLIAGIGTIGCEVALTLSLYGVGRLILIDKDTVEAENIGRQVLYSLEDVTEERTKVEAAKQRLERVVPGVRITPLMLHIPSSASSTFSVEVDGYIVGCDAEKNLSLIEKAVKESDAVISCVDNFATRRTVAILSLGNNKPYVDTGVEGAEGHVVTVLPGKDFSCIGCDQRDVPWLTGEVGVVESTGKVRAVEGGCTKASLSAIKIAGAVAADNLIKILHSNGDKWPFGEPTNWFRFNLRYTTFLSVQSKRDPSCRICKIAVDKYIREGVLSILSFSG